jgi:hypothetical protein
MNITVNSGSVVGRETVGALCGSNHGTITGGISGQNNYIAGILVEKQEHRQVSAIQPFGEYNGGMNESNFSYNPSLYYEGETKDCYRSGTGPSFGIGKVEGASPVNNQNTGCTSFSIGQPADDPAKNWGIGTGSADNYWQSLGSCPNCIGSSGGSYLSAARASLKSAPLCSLAAAVS